MAKAEIVTVNLACSKCKRRNYTYRRNKKRKKNPKKTELKKYCRFCRQHTIHKEVK
ncbi:MAG: 50S ribosomal protein L33 [Candidatus Aerophobus sp.]|nr:MAG: 50S ribosomal protein L33 [Candidatus Aerophobus sp.]